jgi:hypothetical protein
MAAKSASSIGLLTPATFTIQPKSDLSLALWQMRCCRGREKHMMRQTAVQIGNPGSNRPSIFDNDGSSHEGVFV